MGIIGKMPTEYGKWALSAKPLGKYIITIYSLYVSINYTCLFFIQRFP